MRSPTARSSKQRRSKPARPPRKVVPEGFAPERRTFAALHRDTWRIVSKAPFVFLAVPALAWFGADVVSSASWAEDLPSLWGDFVDGLRYFVVVLVTGIHLAALRVIAEGRTPTVRAAIQEGFFLYGRMISVYFSAGWRIALGTLLLILPGIYLAVRYALAAPIAAFEDKTGTDALHRSSEYVEGSSWAVGLRVFTAALLYAPLALSPIVLFGLSAENPIWDSIVLIPLRVATSLVTVSLTLMYADFRDDWLPAPPLGQTRHRNTTTRGTSVVRQADCNLRRAARPRLTFSRMSDALAVQIKGLGS